MRPFVAIVGRPNVGKSTLFNRLAGKPLAIVENLPGTTRDRVFADADVEGRAITLVDTGGLELKAVTGLAEKVKSQVQMAINEADVILFVTDAKDGLLSSDREVAELLRRTNKPVITVVNKVDRPIQESQVAEFYQLGIGDPVPVSAYHNQGIGALTDQLLAKLPVNTTEVVQSDRPKLAIVGRPGVGKSTLLNAFLGQERAVVNDVPGTTRDALNTVFEYDGREVELIDTAGIRRRGHIDHGIEYYGVIRALRAITECDVAMLILDATESITAQDLHIAGYVKEAVKGMLIVINKMDLVPTEKHQELTQRVEERFKFAQYVSYFYISAKMGKGIDQLIPHALQILEERHKMLPETVVNQLISNTVKTLAIPRRGTRVVKFYRAFQLRTNPPAFVIAVNEPDLVHFSYKRHLENVLRQTFGFYGTPIELIFRKPGRSAKGAA